MTTHPLIAEAQVTGKEVILFGFLCIVMILAVLSDIKRGTVKLKYGIVANRRDSPVEFWAGVVVSIFIALVCIGVFVFLFTGWLGWWGHQ